MDIVIRATCVFVLLLFLLRLLGRRELAQLSPFEFVGLVMLGDLVQQSITHTDTSLTAAILAVATFLFLTFLISWVGWARPRVKDVLEGKPMLLIYDGKVREDGLARERITMAEVESDMRMEGITSIQEVAVAVVEPDGRISFIRRSDLPDSPSSSTSLAASS